MTGTTRRTCGDDYVHALSLLKRGVSVQNIRNMTGCDMNGMAGLLKAPPRAVPRRGAPVTSGPFQARPIGKIPPRRKTLVIEETARKYGLTLDEFFEESAARRASWPRQEAMWRMKHELGMGGPDIAQTLKLKDPSTVLHGVRSHAARLAWGAVLRVFGGGA